MSIFMLFLHAAMRPGISLSLQSTPLFQPAYFRQLRFAHRGGYAYGPENTQELISQNVRQRGINALEIDIRMTRDGYLVLFHDEKISRTLKTNRDARVADLTLQELQAIPLRDQRLGEVYVTEFSEFLAMIQQMIQQEGRKLMVELDFKPHGGDQVKVVRALMQQLQHADAEMGGKLLEHLFISTFYPEVLAEIRKYSQKIVLAFSVNRDSPTDILMSRLAALCCAFVVRKFDCAIIEPNSCWVTPRFVRRWTRRGRLINTFTANSAYDKSYLENLQIAYTTNCPDGTCNDDWSDLIGDKKRWCKACA
jgi:glycerophosphoryl diester phosphodiesterase